MSCWLRNINKAATNERKQKKSCRTCVEPLTQLGNEKQYQHDGKVPAF